jgi:uncharacterized protein DUF6602
MNSTLRYYHGVVQQLRAEVDFINDIFDHQGVKGEGNETIIRDLIAKFIPKRYGIGTGIVIDRQGKQSKQCDIVIYDTILYPSFMSMTSVHFFPVDIVYAVIEIKTRLTTTSIRQARENIASVKSLDFIPDKFMGAEPRGGSFRFLEYTPDPPQGYIFAYNSNTSKFETFKQWFAPNDKFDIPHSPVLVGCLDQGLLHYELDNGTFATKLEAGLLHKGWLFPLVDEALNPVIVPANLKTYAHGGITYPVKRVEGKYVAVDQGKTLLFFLMFLSEMLSNRRINPSISFINEYFLSLSSRFCV